MGSFRRVALMRAMLRRLTRAACISVHAPDGSHSYVAIFFILVLPNTVGGSGTAVPPEFAFRLKAIEQLSDSERRFSLSSEDFALLNPNIRTCPVFRSKVDAELTKKVYYRVPVLVNEKIANGNPWCVTHRQGLFNMTTGSSFFKTAKE